MEPLEGKGTRDTTDEPIVSNDFGMRASDLAQCSLRVIDDQGTR